MKFRTSVVRALMASAAIAAAVALAGCQTDGVSPSARSLKPLSQEMLTELERKNMPKESPILVRLFKEQAELEVWKQDNDGRFALLKTYPICRWSGELGPKVKEGDRQAPEGFYTITPGQMNPNSSYYLSVNIGYPNDFDKAHGRTGAFLMIHGDCSSRGCYAMTDEQISEIYALARESFFGGQRSFQVQAYPFRMTPLNMARHRNNPNMPFWKMLKEGHDHFEVTRLQPKVDVCDKRYVFDAEPPANASPVNASAFKFTPAGRCPVYQVPQEIADEVAAKTKRDAVETAALAARGTPAAPVRTGTDGGMHPVFLAKLNPHVIHDSDGSVRTVIESSAPGTIPPTVNPPREPGSGAVTSGTVMANTPPAASQPRGGFALASSESKPAPSGRPATAESGNMFTRLFSSDDRPQRTSSGQPDTGFTASVSRLFGRGEEKKPAAVPTPVPKPAQAARINPPAHPAAASQPQAKPQTAEAPATAPAAEPSVRTSAANGTALLPGAQPVVPAGTFESRWGNWR